MPKNNNLPPVNLPMELKFDKKPNPKVVNNLISISASLMYSPTLNQVRKMLPYFLEATWEEHPTNRIDLITVKEADRIIKSCFRGETLPTALETIRFTYLITGISMQEVTHILRHRNASFSADCSGDKWWTDKNILIPSSIQQSDEFRRRYENLAKENMNLYTDMIDSRKISIMDARYILPRCIETYYYMSIGLGDLMRFVHQRIDRQIQPETDNLLAYLMWHEACRKIPLLYDIINLEEQAAFYIKTARTGRATNLYQPEPNNDVFEWNEEDFIYRCTRSELNGTNEDAYNRFELYKNSILEMFDIDKKCAANELEEEYKLNTTLIELPFV